MKNVLVTGGAKGIGKAICDEFRSCGYNVFSPARQEMDISNPDSIHNYAESLKTAIDVLVNNAGINILGGIEEIDENDIAAMINTNLTGPLALIKAIVPYMKKNGYGRIINISSIWGVRSKERRLLYSASKFGINGVTKSLAGELGKYNILVNSVAPGYVNTELTQKNVSPEEQAKIKSTIPLGRFAEPCEIAKVVRFLGSEDNTYITGQVITADGGFLA
ncbi:MAG: SDR family NAD(P)-dependent oxidoreductase [Deferribacterales bacterium]